MDPAQRDHVHPSPHTDMPNMNMQIIADLELNTFREAIDGLAREELKLLKNDLVNKKEDIELQLAARSKSAADTAPDHTDWKVRAQAARTFTVRKMTLVDAALARTQRTGGYLIKLSRRSTLGFSSSIWLATEKHPAEVLVDELCQCSGATEAPDVQIFGPLTREQFERLPEWTRHQAYEH